jgi:hypothetical protein
MVVDKVNDAHHLHLRRSPVFLPCMLRGHHQRNRMSNSQERRCDVTKKEQRRILRNYRSATPSRFHAFNQRVRKGLTDNSKIPESTWAANPTLIPSYLAASEKHDAKYHEALYCSKLDIAEREVLQAQLINYLDEIASILEAVAVRCPDVLLASGFDLAKERRSRTRTNAASTASEDSQASNAVQHPSE